jgi:hypothetical protein
MGLTEKQAAFAKAVVEADPETGKNRTLADAYRSTYDTDGCTSKTVRDEASRLRSDPGVTAAVEREQARVERLRVRDAANVRRSILSRLDSIADDPAQSGSSRVGALRLAGLEAGMFRERSQVEVAGILPKSEGDTLAEIEAVLREALEKG